MIKTVNEQNLVVFCEKLAEDDSDLDYTLKTYGTPPLWARAKGFPTLVHIILEQQVSLASARACFDKLCQRLETVTPANFLTLNDNELKTVGFSRQKTAYVRNLAEAVLNEKINLEELENLPDEEVKSKLIELKGIGDWTAECYLLMVLLRVDVMPKGDLGLHIAWKDLKNLTAAPKSDEFQQIAEKWKPYRAVAARLLWHFYLSERNARSKGSE
jgi:DNA-3-methyladenine glycosylase II